MSGPVTEMNVISIELTWVNSLPMLLAVLENGTPKGRAMARRELLRMAKAADAPMIPPASTERPVT